MSNKFCKQDSEDIANICSLIVETLITNPYNSGALHCAAALGAALAALAKSAEDNNDIVFAFGLDTAIALYEKHRKD